MEENFSIFSKIFSIFGASPLAFVITLLIVTFLFLFNTTDVFAKTETLKGVTDFEVYPDESLSSGRYSEEFVLKQEKECIEENIILKLI